MVIFVGKLGQLFPRQRKSGMVTRPEKTYNDEKIITILRLKNKSALEKK
jgi:hypothetical protein